MQIIHLINIEIVVYYACLCAQLYQTLHEPLDSSPEDPSLFMRFSRQEYWSGLPFPSSGDLPDPGIKPASSVPPALAGRFFFNC